MHPEAKQQTFRLSLLCIASISVTMDWSACLHVKQLSRLLICITPCICLVYPLNGPSWLFGDNKTVGHKFDHPALNKQWNVFYHQVCEMVAANIMCFDFINGPDNPVSILTKPLSWHKAHVHEEPLLFFRKVKPIQMIKLKHLAWSDKSIWHWPRMMTEFRQPIQVQSHLEMLGILVQLGHIQRT